MPLISPTSMTSAVKRLTPGIRCAVIAHQPEPPVTGLLLVASHRSRRRPRCHGQAWSATACAPPSLRPTHGSLGTPERPCPFAGFAPRCYTSLGERRLPFHRGTNQARSPLPDFRGSGSRRIYCCGEQLRLVKRPLGCPLNAQDQRDRIRKVSSVVIFSRAVRSAAVGSRRPSRCPCGRRRFTTL